MDEMMIEWKKKYICNQNSDHKNVLLLKRLFTKITFKANNSILRSIKN